MRLATFSYAGKILLSLSSFESSILTILLRDDIGSLSILKYQFSIIRPLSWIDWIISLLFSSFSWRFDSILKHFDSVTVDAFCPEQKAWTFIKRSHMSERTHVRSTMCDTQSENYSVWYSNWRSNNKLCSSLPLPITFQTKCHVGVPWRSRASYQVVFAKLEQSLALDSPRKTRIFMFTLIFPVRRVAKLVFSRTRSCFRTIVTV